VLLHFPFIKTELASRFFWLLDGVVHDHNAVAGTWTLDYDSTSGNRAYVELRELLSDLNRRRRADMPLVAMGA
jgi:hypothetical protein